MVGSKKFPHSITAMDFLHSQRPIRSVEDGIATATSLLNIGAAAAAQLVLKTVISSVKEKSHPQLAHLTLQIAYALGDVEQVERLTDIKALRTCVDVVKAAQPVERSYSVPACILVCAGGDSLLTQLVGNLKSMCLHGPPDMPVVVAHADELDEIAEAELSSEFDDVNFIFLNLLDSEYWNPNEPGGGLRGFQIKLAALALVDASEVFLMDADLLWLRNSTQVFDLMKKKGDAYLCHDLWHFITKCHSRSCSTRFVFSLFEVDSNCTEYESGLLYMAKGRAPKAVAMLREMARHHRTLFKYTFGDKDLYAIALKYANASLATSPPPELLGATTHTSAFQAQSMLHHVGGAPSHIHTTLHPLGDPDLQVPGLVSETRHVEFKTETLPVSQKRVATVSSAVSRPLDMPVVQFVYRTAMREAASWAATRARDQ